MQLVCRARPLICGEWGLFEPALPIPGEQVAEDVEGLGDTANNEVVNAYNSVLPVVVDSLLTKRATGLSS